MKHKDKKNLKLKNLVNTCNKQIDQQKEQIDYLTKANLNLLHNNTAKELQANPIQ